jgi:hypothetical protein
MADVLTSTNSHGLFRMHRRWLPLLSFALLATEAPACTITIDESPQVLVRRAALVAEATAKDGLTFEITKLHKGMASPQVLLGGFGFKEKCEPKRMGVEGRRYLIVVDAAGTRKDGPVTYFGGKALAYPIEDAAHLLEYLEHPVDVTRKDMDRMLRSWKERTIGDAAMAAWLRKTAPVANVSDWTRLYIWDEVSLTLTILEKLDARVNDPRGFETLSCELSGLRERVVPKVLEALDERRLTPELLERVEKLFTMSTDELCSGDAEPAVAEGGGEPPLEMLP